MIWENKMKSQWLAIFHQTDGQMHRDTVKCAEDDDVKKKKGTQMLKSGYLLITV
jgi:hypothetical protein